MARGAYKQKIMRKFIGNAKTLLRSYAEPEPF